MLGFDLLLLLLSTLWECRQQQQSPGNESTPVSPGRAWGASMAPNGQGVREQENTLSLHLSLPRPRHMTTCAWAWPSIAIQFQCNFNWIDLVNVLRVLTHSQVPCCKTPQNVPEKIKTKNSDEKIKTVATDYDVDTSNTAQNLKCPRNSMHFLSALAMHDLAATSLFRLN